MCASRLPFDFSKARGPRSGPDVSSDVTAAIVGGSGAPAAISVSMLLAMIKGALTQAMPARMTVVGEISNLKTQSSGHLYFSLKDAKGCISAAMWKGSAARLKFRPTDGLEVVVEGRVDIYDVRGQLQFYVESMTPKGAGSLELAFRQLHDKLKGEGLFDPACKVPIPRYPRAIGLITSPTGAAVRDIGRTLGRRWPAAKIYLLPVLVQGDQAAPDIAQAIAAMDAQAQHFQIDTIIVGRGGGSMEDLWAFNEEVVARAIFACRTPIISGVGHEVDTTIADLVADLRAPTPTGAAELAVPDSADVRRHLAQLGSRLARRMGELFAHARTALEACARSAVFRDPLRVLRTQVQRTDELSHRLRAAARHRLAVSERRLDPLAGRLAALHPARLRERAARRLEELVARLRWVLGARSKKAGDHMSALASRMVAAHPRNRLALATQQLQAAHRHLEALSYRSVLGRGFSVTRLGDGAILRAAADVKPGALLETELIDGKFKSAALGAAGGDAGNKEDVDDSAWTDSRKPSVPEPRKPRRPRPQQNDDDQLVLF